MQKRKKIGKSEKDNKGQKQLHTKEFLFILRKKRIESNVSCYGRDIIFFVPLSSKLKCPKYQVLCMKKLLGDINLGFQKFEKVRVRSELPSVLSILHSDSNFVRKLHTFEKQFVELFNWVNADFERQTANIPASAKTANRPCKDYQYNKPDYCPKNIHFVQSLSGNLEPVREKFSDVKK